MSHTLTMVDETKEKTLQNMHSYTCPEAFAQDFTSPRLANRQMKYFFANLQHITMATVLGRLQRIFQSSEGYEQWVLAFIGIVGLCMANEDQQKTIHQVMQTRAVTEQVNIRNAQLQAEHACHEIDQQMDTIAQTFRNKYTCKLNPLRDSEYEWERETGFDDKSSAAFVRGVAQLVEENGE